MVSASGKRDWGTDFVVIVIDDHNRLQMEAHRYTGLDHVGANGETAIAGYVHVLTSLPTLPRWFMGTQTAPTVLEWILNLTWMSWR